MLDIKKNNSGFTLIEILIAMAIFIIALLALVGLQANLIKGNKGSKHVTSATFLAESKIEELRVEGYTSLVNGVVVDANNPLNADGSNGGIFNRSWTVTDVAGMPGVKKVLVTVTWSDSVAQNRSVSLETLLSDKVD